MFYNYLKIDLRNLAKNKVYLLVNLLGLSFAISCCIISYSNYKFQSEFFQNHSNAKRLWPFVSVAFTIVYKVYRAACLNSSFLLKTESIF